MAARRVVRLAILVLIGVVVAAAGAVAAFVLGGVSARPEPRAVERILAPLVRNAAIRWHAGNAPNPVPRTPEVLAEGREHFADHCASCHANDGSGNTEMGRGLYPKAPDMRLPATQQLTDAQLFYIIENGVRLTGMPAWATGTPEGEAESWALVHFIRELPRLTAQDIEAMKARNPRSPEEIRQEIEEERFLRGETP